MLVLADEPTGNLDSRAADEIAGLLHQVAKEWGHAVLMVTHDPRIAAYADRIMFLKDGTIVNETNLAASTAGERETAAGQVRAVLQIMEGCDDEEHIPHPVAGVCCSAWRWPAAGAR